MKISADFTLAEANAARKIVGKKQMDKIPELHQKVLDKAKSSALGNYVWTFGIGPQMGYSFSIIHALAYSFYWISNYLYCFKLESYLLDSLFK